MLRMAGREMRLNRPFASACPWTYINHHLGLLYTNIGPLPTTITLRELLLIQMAFIISSSSDCNNNGSELRIVLSHFHIFSNSHLVGKTFLHIKCIGIFCFRLFVFTLLIEASFPHRTMWESLSVLQSPLTALCLDEALGGLPLSTAIPSKGGTTGHERPCDGPYPYFSSSLMPLLHGRTSWGKNFHMKECSALM